MQNSQWDINGTSIEYISSIDGILFVLTSRSYDAHIVCTVLDTMLTVDSPALFSKNISPRQSKGHLTMLDTQNKIHEYLASSV